MAAVPDKVKDALIKAIPFRRLGKPEEVAEAVLFFAGPAPPTSPARCSASAAG